jgi:hypothetical protein
MTRIATNKVLTALCLAAAILAILAVSCSPDEAAPECEGDGSASGCAQGSYCGIDNKCITDCTTNAECQTVGGLYSICDTQYGKCIDNTETGGTDVDSDGDSDTGTTSDGGADGGDDAGDDGGMDSGQ